MRGHTPTVLGMRLHRPVALALAGLALTACGAQPVAHFTATAAPVAAVTVTAAPAPAVTVTAKPRPAVTRRVVVTVTPKATAHAVPSPSPVSAEAHDVACHAVEPLVNAWLNGVLPADPSQLTAASVTEIAQAVKFTEDNVRSGMALDPQTRVLLVAIGQDGKELQAASKLGDAALIVVDYETLRVDVGRVAAECPVDSATS